MHVVQLILASNWMCFFIRPNLYFIFIISETNSRSSTVFISCYFVLLCTPFEITGIFPEYREIVSRKWTYISFLPAWQESTTKAATSPNSVSLAYESYTPSVLCPARHCSRWVLHNLSALFASFRVYFAVVSKLLIDRRRWRIHAQEINFICTLPSRLEDNNWIAEPVIGRPIVSLTVCSNYDFLQTKLFIGSILKTRKRMI